MAKEDFFLNLIGKLDEEQTQRNVQESLDKVGKKVKLDNKSKTKVTLFDKDKLNEEKKVFFDASQDIRKSLESMFNPKGSKDFGLKIKETFDDSQVTKFKAEVLEAGKVMQTLNFERVKLANDQGDAFLLKSKTSIDNSDSIKLQAENKLLTERKRLLKELESQRDKALSGKGKVTDETQVKAINDAYAKLRSNIKDFDVSQSTEGVRKFFQDQINGFDNVIEKAKEAQVAINKEKAEMANAPIALKTLQESGDVFYRSVNDFVKENSVFINGMKGSPKIFESFDKDGNLIAFTSQIKNAYGALETLRFKVQEVEIEEGKMAEVFVRDSISISDNTFVQQANEITKLDNKLSEFNAKYQNGAFNFLSPDKSPVTGRLIEEANSQITNLMNNAGTLTQTEITKVHDFINEIIKSAEEFEKASAKEQADANKTAKAISKQTQDLREYKILLENTSKTKLNKDSRAFIGDVEGVDKLIERMSMLESYRQNLLKRSMSGEIIPQKTFDTFELMYKQLMADINNLKKSATVSIGGNIVENDGSAQNLSNKINVARSNMDLLIQKYKEAGIYTGDFKTKVDALRDSLNDVRNQAQFSNFEASLKMLKNEASGLELELKQAFRSEELTRKLALLKQQIDAFAQSNPRALNVYSQQFENLRKGIANATSSNDLKLLQNQFQSLKVSIRSAGLEGLSFGQRIQNAMKKFMQWTGVTSSVMYTVRAIRELIQNVKDLDSSMVSLKKVTNETESTYKQMLDTAIQKAKELNTSVTNIIDSTAEFSKLGFAPEVASELAEVATIYANVGEIDIETATKNLVSTINGFKDLTADDAEGIADVLNNLGNKFAVSSADLGEILQRSSAALSEANNGLNEAVALGTVAQTINQDASRVGKIMLTLNSTQNGETPEVDNTVGKALLKQ